MNIEKSIICVVITLKNGGVFMKKRIITIAYIHSSALKLER